MTSFDFAPLLAGGLPPPAARFTGFPKYNFVGGHNDAEHVPVDALVAAATAVLTREGRTLATYGLASGPQGYRPLREFLVCDAAYRKRLASTRADDWPQITAEALETDGQSYARAIGIALDEGRISEETAENVRREIG